MSQRTSEDTEQENEKKEGRQGYIKVRAGGKREWEERWAGGKENDVSGKCMMKERLLHLHI